MAEPFLSEIRIMSFEFAPKGWALRNGQFLPINQIRRTRCRSRSEGQLLPIAEGETLFQLLGTTYDGDGESTFALPDLRRRIPIHPGNGFILAAMGGAEEITLTVPQTSPLRRAASSSRTR